MISNSIVSKTLLLLTLVTQGSMEVGPEPGVFSLLASATVFSACQPQLSFEEGVKTYQTSSEKPRRNTN